jgi:hypothetical protein
MTVDKDPDPSVPTEEVAQDDSMVLALADLLPDSGGEIVIHSGGIGRIDVITERTITATGTTAEHITAAGENVTGFKFYTLDSGVKLYCPIDTTLALGREIS